ncbi:MAG: glycosyltransferase [Bryobacteraceae bacterium]
MPEIQPEAAEAPPLRVSVLIVAHDSAAALRKCVAALEAAPDRAEFEVLLVDNGSTDGSQSLDREFPEIQMLRLPHYCGLTKARNIGIRTCKAEYLLLLAPDVVLDPGAVTKLADRLAADTSALAVCPTLLDDAGKTVSRTFRLPDAGQVSANWENPLSQPASGGDLHDGKAILLRKQTIQGINYLDSRFGEHWIDVDLAYQIRKAGKKIALAEDVRGRWNAADPLWKPATAQERAAFAADAANGAAAYLGKHFGFMSGLGLRIRLVLGALVKVLTFQDPGYSFGLLSRLVSGYKIDGSSQKL